MPVFNRSEFQSFKRDFVSRGRSRYIDARVEWLVWTRDTEQKLERLPLLRETGSPKVVLYETQNDGLLDYDEVKKRRVNIFTGVGVGASTQRMTEVMDMFAMVQSTSSPEMRDKSCLAVMVKVDSLKSKSALDVVRAKLPRKTSTAVITLDPEQTDLLARIRRGKRAFGTFG